MGESAITRGEQVHPTRRDDWRAWLAANHSRSGGVWLVSYKQRTGQPRVTYEEVVCEALCFGWIDSLARTLDDERSMLWMSPRNVGSGWSRSNKLRIERLLAGDDMAPAGLAVVEAARRDGSWTALDDVEDLVVPDDLAAAFEAAPPGRRHWDAFPRSVRRAILAWISTAKRADTRQRRIAETARLAARNERANQSRPRS